MRLLCTLLTVMLLAATTVEAGSITRPTKSFGGSSFINNVIPQASDFNGDVDTIYSEFNGNIDNANIKAGAAIDGSKIVPAWTSTEGVTNALPCFRLVESDQAADAQRWMLCSNNGAVQIGTYTDGDILQSIWLSITRAGIFDFGAPIITGAAAKDLVVANSAALRAVNNAGTNADKLLDNDASDNVNLYSANALRFRMTSAGIGLFGTTVATGASAGDLVVANAVGLRSVNAAASTTYKIAGLDSNDELTEADIHGTGYPVRTLTRSVNQNTVGGSAAESSQFTYTIPGGTLGSNRMLKIIMIGDYENSTGSSQTPIVRVKYGSNAIGPSGATLASQVAKHTVKLECEITASNATNSQYATCQLWYSTDVSGNWAPIPGSGFIAAGHNNWTVDSTVNQTLSITTQNSSGAAGEIFRKQYVLVELH